MYILVFGAVLGAILGSFAKALADRSLTNRSFLTRSHCELCKRVLKPQDLVPLISYLLLKGKCRYCKEKLSTEYLVVEAVMGVLVAALFWINWPNLPQLLYQVFFVTILVTIFLTDLKEMFIPDRVIIPALVIGVILLALLAPSQFIPSILTSFLIGLFFLTLVLITGGKGMGGGDIKLGAFIGLLGPPAGFLAIMLGFLLGAIFGLTTIILGKKGFKDALPFGPFLVIGSLITLFLGNEILDWYLKLQF